MNLQWIHETPPQWDADKARLIRAAPPGTLGVDKLARFAVGDLIPGDWWRVEVGGAIVGYGWMDSTWGDAEILLFVDPERRRQGVGTFILTHLEDEARSRGFNYLYNVIPKNHPDGAGIERWLGNREFNAFADGSLRRSVVPREAKSAS